VPLLDEFPVDLVFEHHDHTYKRTRPLKAGLPHPEGLVFVGDGNWGRGIRQTREADYLEKRAATFNVLGVMLHSDGRQEVEVFDEAGNIIDRFRIQGD
jgi:hypothetical protein